MEQWNGVDWVVLWKLYRYWFFVLYVVISLPCKFRLLRTPTAPKPKIGILSAISSVACPASNVWFPLIPILGTTLICALTGRDAYNQPIRFIVPAVAVLMGIQAAALDAAIICIAFRNQREPSGWRNIFTINAGTALVAVGIACWWITRHPPIIIA